LNALLPNRDHATAVDAARCALAGGDIGTAERLCAEIVTLAPGCAQAWMVLTETALLRNRPDAAIVSANHATTLAPDDPIAHTLRAKTLFVIGEAGQARRAAETALQVVGTAPEATDALGAVFGLLGQHQIAATLFQRAVAARRDVPQYWFNLAATERMTGMLDAAEDHCDAAIAIDRNFALAHYLRSDLRVQSRERNHIAEMESLIRDGALGLDGEVLVRFALAKEYEDLEENDRAFDCVASACRLHRQSIDYDAAAEIAEVDRIVRFQNRGWLASRPSGFSGADPVFVVGLPRTGTTVVERIIASHSAMASAGETGAFRAELSRASKENSGNTDLAQVGRRYMESVWSSAVPRNQRFVDKTPENYLHCGAIHAALPRAKIILVRRHPLDTCWALYKAHFRGKFPFSYDQLELAEYYLAFRRSAQHWRATLPMQVLLEISYEDIVHNQEAASRRLIEFIGLSWEHDVLRFHESRAPSATASAVQVRRPLYSSSVRKWRHHAERLAPLRARLARDIGAMDLE
jgi:tetratricopeptide (TPR) repeat protein